jgi:hypothetical protein
MGTYYTADDTLISRSRSATAMLVRMVTGSRIESSSTRKVIPQVQRVTERSDRLWPRTCIHVMSQTPQRHLNLTTTLSAGEVRNAVCGFKAITAPSQFFTSCALEKLARATAIQTLQV